jgi:hypothetical protein
VTGRDWRQPDLVPQRVPPGVPQRARGGYR